MQVNSTNNINFTSVIPVRVMNGTEDIRNFRVVQKACREAVKVISGPLREKPQFKPAASQLAVMDSDYRFNRAFYGYERTLQDRKLTPSQFFKIIYDRFNRGYIVTGEPSEILSGLGHEIGRAKRQCNQYGMLTSPRLESAKNTYRQAYANIGNNIMLRIREAFDPITLEKNGKFQQMNLHISTKPVKIKGKPDTKVKLENITFSDMV